MFSYASTLEFGHYSRLEQLQRRLWYFSYLKYPISSLYHLLTNPARSIVSAEQPLIFYSRPCAGCLRCQPTLLGQYRLSVKAQEVRSSFFSRIYQSNRSSSKAPPPAPLPMPSENPECGLEYPLETGGNPIQLWVRVGDDPDGFQVELSDRLERFQYEKEKWQKQSCSVRHVRFQPTVDLIKKHFLINQEKVEAKKENESDNNSELPMEYRIELSEKPLKFMQINPEASVNRRVLGKPTTSELEEAELEKKGIFLFSPRWKSPTQPS